MRKFKFLLFVIPIVSVVLLAFKIGDELIDFAIESKLNNNVVYFTIFLWVVENVFAVEIICRIFVKN